MALQSPTPDKLPETPQAALTQFPNQDEYYQNQIVEPINKIVAYFDEKDKLTEDTSKARYYRAHLGNTKNGDVVVQDFYTDTETKQSSIILIDKVDLLKFKQMKNIHNPFTHSYSKKGKLIRLNLYKNGLATKEIAYKDNKIFYSAQIQYDEKNHFPKTKVFRSNGQLWAVILGNCEDFSKVTSTVYDKDQIRIAESLLIKDENTTCVSPKTFNLTFFDKNGSKITQRTHENNQSYDEFDLFLKLFNPDYLENGFTE